MQKWICRFCFFSLMKKFFHYSDNFFSSLWKCLKKWYICGDIANANRFMNFCNLKWLWKWRILNFELLILNCLRNVENSELWFLISELPPDENLFKHEWSRIAREFPWMFFLPHADLANLTKGQVAAPCIEPPERGEFWIVNYEFWIASGWEPFENSELWIMNSELPPDAMIF